MEEIARKGIGIEAKKRIGQYVALFSLSFENTVCISIKAKSHKQIEGLGERLVGTVLAQSRPNI